MYDSHLDILSAIRTVITIPVKNFTAGTHYFCLDIPLRVQWPVAVFAKPQIWGIVMAANADNLFVLPFEVGSAFNAKVRCDFIKG